MIRWLSRNRKKLFFSVIALVVFLVAAELLARWWLADYALRTYGVDLARYRDVKLVPDGGVGWKWGGQVVFRGPREVSVDKPPGRYRILTTGDSCCWGAPVSYDATYSAVLEQMLQEKYGPDRVEVHNAGVVGYSIRQVIRLFRETLSQFQPDLIIHYGTGAGGDEYIVGPRRSASPWLERLDPFFFRSKAFLVLKHALRTRRPRPQTSSFLVESLEIHDLKKAVQKAGGKLMLVEYGYVENGRIHSEIEGHGLKLEIPVVRTHKALTELGLPVRELIYDHVHPTTLGHALIGRRIFEELVRLGWIEEALSR